MPKVGKIQHVNIIYFTNVDRGRTPAHPLIHSGCPLLNLVHVDFEFVFRKTYEKLIIYLFFEEKY